MTRYFWTYILHCNDDSYYVGMTNNLEQRIEFHESGSDPSSYTFDKRPVKLVFYKMFNDPESAIALEKKLKGSTRAKKQALINGDFDKLKGLSKKQF